MKTQLNSNQGYVLVIVLVLMAAGALLVSGSLSLSSSSLRTSSANDQRTVRFLATETAFNQAAAWVRENSQELLSPFLRDQFYSSFTRTSIGVGANDTAYTVPTKIKLASSTNSAILTNSASLATSTFPTSIDSSSGSSLDVTTLFAAENFGSQLVRITLFDAIANDPALDYGAPPSGTPETDFYPVYRIDAMSATDQGSHVYGYVIGSLVESGGFGFFGKDSVEVAQDCDSYDSSAGSYVSGSANANCGVASEGSICIKSNADVYGSVDTQASISTASQCGGRICADTSCSSTGSSCEGSSCNIPSMPVYQDWSDYCPSNQGNYSVPVNTTVTLSLGSGNPTDNCWDSIYVGRNGILVLETTAYPYYVNSISMHSQGEIRVVPDSATGSVNFHTWSIGNNKINGNDTINSGGKPNQFIVHYLGTSDLKINGNADMWMGVIAPYVDVDLQGNADFYGGVMAKSLTMTGSLSLHYDESLGVVTTSDLTYRPRYLGQYYR